MIDGECKMPSLMTMDIADDDNNDDDDDLDVNDQAIKSRKNDNLWMIISIVLMVSISLLFFALIASYCSRSKRARGSTCDVVTDCEPDDEVKDQMVTLSVDEEDENGVKDTQMISISSTQQ